MGRVVGPVFGFQVTQNFASFFFFHDVRNGKSRSRRADRALNPSSIIDQSRLMPFGACLLAAEKSTPLKRRGGPSLSATFL
jgi:hypothetical protein